ncbi:MAG: DegQ family serine endoprotease [Syntrophales bacterium]|jgi:serine protease Do|nr:DegQ family serine endoprotease [Syntrophales bacterium]MCK9527162.1 DegQ family serine endoprotease [Syntrophales bacterium]MDX9921713.1 DegQ family serine endoprotease [Syntrophales bacterium]
MDLLQQRRKGRFVQSVIPGVVGLAILVALTVTAPAGDAVAREAKSGAVSVPAPVVAYVPSSFTDLAEHLKPGVVNIRTTKIVSGGDMYPFGTPFRGSPFDRFFGGEDFFKRFFGDRPGREYRQRSLGSGFVISSDGYIFTNNHVIERAEEILVRLSDGNEYRATVKGSDRNTDIALLKIEADGDLPVVTLGTSSELRVGEWVMAIGNPFGLSQTVTVGIVSATGRVIGAGPYDDFIQTDASINPGNSGGPLFNMAGEVVGINTAIVAQGQGIGFAIPIDMAKEILPALKKEGRVTRGWLGISVQDVTAEISESLGLKSTEGVLVAHAFEGDPAAAAGIKSGDVIVSIDGRPIKDTQELLRVVASIPVGTKVPLGVIRQGVEKKFTVTVKERPDPDAMAFTERSEDRFGMTVQPITADMAQHFGLTDTSGVIITAVDPAGKAAEAGIRTADIIVSVNNARIDSIQDYHEALTRADEHKSLLLLIKRDDTRFFVVIKP